MAKILVKKDRATDRREFIFALDSASTTGAGINNVSMTGYYVRNTTGTTPSASVFTPGATQPSTTNMPGVYWITIPAAAFASTNGADTCVVHLSGSGMAPIVLEYQLVAFDPDQTIASAVWDATASSYTTGGTFGKLIDIMKKSIVSIDGKVTNGVTRTEARFATNLSSATYGNDFFIGQTVVFTDNNLIGQSSVISDYISTDGVIILDSPLSGVPDFDSGFVILPTHVHPSEEVGQAVLDKRIGEAGRMPYVSASLSTSTNVITGFNAYKEGDRVTPAATTGNFTAGATYYVKAGPTPMSFQLASGGSGNAAITPTVAGTVTFMPIEERTTRAAIQYLRNRVNLASSTLTVYSEDDTVASWTSSVSTSGTTTPITESNPVD